MSGGRDSPDVLGTIDRVTFEASVHLLAAGLILIAAGVAGVGGSVAFVGLALVAAVALFAVRRRVPSPGTVAGHDLRYLIDDSWIVPALAATTAAVALGASPGEMQTLGGVLGLVAVANYFLRPAYYLVYSFAARVGDAA